MEADKIIPADSFVCAQCGGLFMYDTEGWSNNDALEEARQHYGEDEIDSLSTVCEDCYQVLEVIKPNNFFEWLSSMVRRENKNND